MFNNILSKFFNKKEKYCSCDLIEHGLDLMETSVILCCRMDKNISGDYVKIIDNYHGEPIDWKKFFKTKRFYRNQMKKGILHPNCRNCLYTETKEWDNDDYISHINIINGNICNFRCIYCTLNDFPREKHYNIYPVLKDLAEKGYLRPGGNITIAGGEPSLIPEFDDTVNLLIDCNLSNIRILTNASRCSEAVLRGIKEGRINLLISTDSGTRETFEKIKRCSCYDTVWENIKKYASVQPYPDRVKTKYILIPNVNDTKEEITAWLDKSVENGVRHVSFDIEIIWYNENENNIPNFIYELTSYMYAETQKRGLAVEFIDRGRRIAEQMKLL